MTNTEIPWSERVPTLSVNPEMATRDDVARLASELMSARAALSEISELASWHYDPEADEMDESPQDQGAHVNGLIVKIVDREMSEELPPAGSVAEQRPAST